MNIASKKLLIVIATAALALAGCTKKPVRPDPSATVLGPQAGGQGINPTDVGLTADANSALVERPAGVIETEDTIRGLLQPVYFDFDKSSIKESERTKLQAAKEYLEKNPQHRLLLEGYCDWQGTAEYNLGLGDRRAAAAKNYLSTIAVPTEKTETLSKGSLEASKNGDDATRAKDRRVELVILKK